MSVGARTRRRAAVRRLRSLQFAATCWVASASYVRKWAVLGIAIGIIAGCGAIVFDEALQAASALFLLLAGYRVPTPFLDGDVAPRGRASATMGAAADRSRRRPFGRGARLPGRPGGGGTWDRRGDLGRASRPARRPLSDGARQARRLGADDRLRWLGWARGADRADQRRVRLAAGAGTRSRPGRCARRGRDRDRRGDRLDLRRAPGRRGAGAEILYRDDFDPAALLPSFVASGVGYAIFGAAEGYAPLFGSHGFEFTDPPRLIWFALIGVIGGLVGLAYAKGFYGLQGLFRRLTVPKWVKPAIGGAVVGLIAIEVPQVLGTGYGWIQHALGPTLASMPLWIVLILPFARILATGLSIGSGGSGGVFGPGMVIGAFVGAAVWRLFEPAFPWMGHDPTPYVIVGMMCCFGTIARAPLAMMLMVAEMTGSVGSIEPGMVAVGLAWLIVSRGEQTMYRSQLISRISDGGPVGRGHTGHLPPIGS